MREPITFWRLAWTNEQRRISELTRVTMANWMIIRHGNQYLHNSKCLIRTRRVCTFRRGYCGYLHIIWNPCDGRRRNRYQNSPTKLASVSLWWLLKIRIQHPAKYPFVKPMQHAIKHHILRVRIAEWDNRLLLELLDRHSCHMMVLRRWSQFSSTYTLIRYKLKDKVDSYHLQNFVVHITTQAIIDIVT